MRFKKKSFISRMDRLKERIWKCALHECFGDRYGWLRQPREIIFNGFSLMVKSLKTMASGLGSPPAFGEDAGAAEIEVVTRIGEGSTCWSLM
jgi:hypothetical protein